MSTAELLFIFLALPILCAIVFGTPFLLVLGKYLEWQDLADKRPNWLSPWTSGNIHSELLLRPAPIEEERIRLMRAASSATAVHSENLVRSSGSTDDCP